MMGWVAPETTDICPLTRSQLHRFRQSSLLVVRVIIIASQFNWTHMQTNVYLVLTFLLFITTNILLTFTALIRNHGIPMPVPLML